MVNTSWGYKKMEKAIVFNNRKIIKIEISYNDKTDYECLKITLDNGKSYHFPLGMSIELGESDNQSLLDFLKENMR